MTGLALVLLAVAAPPQIAAPPWRTVNVPADLAGFYAEHVAQKLRANGLKVITAQEIATLLDAERQRQLLGCADDGSNCLAELGNALGCEGTLVVNLAKLEDLYQANLKVLSTKDGRALAETSVRVTGEKALLEALDDAAKTLADGVLGPVAPTGVTARVPLRQRSWIPAAAGVVVAVVGVSLLAVASGKYEALDEELRAQRMVTPAAERLASSGSAFHVGGWTALGVGIAALLVGVGFFVFGGGT